VRFLLRPKQVNLTLPNGTMEPTTIDMNHPVSEVIKTICHKKVTDPYFSWNFSLLD
jgi:hypothetical protein